jgi:hypothetical protein
MENVGVMVTVHGYKLNTTLSTGTRVPVEVPGRHFLHNCTLHTSRASTRPHRAYTWYAKYSCRGPCVSAPRGGVSA